MVSDKSGKFVLPAATGCKMRKIANLEQDGSNTISKDFSASGKIADIKWAKVWDAKIADGNLITKVTGADGKTTEVKTGKILDDVAPSATAYAGTLQVTLSVP